MLHWNRGGPVFVSRWNSLIGVRAPGIKASCSATHRHAAPLSPLCDRAGAAGNGVCRWMRTEPCHNNTKWCLGWQKLICARYQRAVINECERGNAVPPLWLLFDGDGKAPKTPAFSLSFLQEVEVTQSTLLLFVTALFAPWIGCHKREQADVMYVEVHSGNDWLSCWWAASYHWPGVSVFWRRRLVPWPSWLAQQKCERTIF